MMKYRCPCCNWEGEAKIICERTKDNSINEPKGWFIDKHVVCSKCGKTDPVNPSLVPDVIIDLTTEEWNAKNHFLCSLNLDVMNRRACRT